MKRNKIKPKYLNQISNAPKKKKEKEEKNFFDKLETTIQKILISIGLIILLLIWEIIPLTILALFNIDYTTLSENKKIIYLIISDILLLAILIKIYYKDVKHDFQEFFNHHLKENLKLSFYYWTIGLVIMVISNTIISNITGGEIATNEETVRNLIKIAPWYMVFEVMIYAPISEELIFRKSIRNIIKNPYIYALVSGIIFGGLHTISSLDSITGLLYLIPYSSLGIIFALLYTKTNNIFSTITIHSFHNFLALILYLIAV